LIGAADLPRPLARAAFFGVGLSGILSAAASVTFMFCFFVLGVLFSTGVAATVAVDGRSLLFTAGFGASKAGKSSSCKVDTLDGPGWA
jgi:hypothetical protein